MYQQIAEVLRQKIADGTFTPGDRLPTEADLVEEYGVSRDTVRKGLTLLVNEGLVISARPTGHFVRKRQPMVFRPQEEFLKRPRAPEMDAFMTEFSAEGREPRQTIDVAIVEPPEDVAKRLHLGPGQFVAVRRRVRYLDGEPFIYDWGDWSVQTLTTYIGKSYLDDQFWGESKVNSVAPRSYTSMQIGYTWNVAQFYVGVDNLFDTKPPRADTNGLLPNSSTGAGTWADVYDALGQRWYAGVKLNF